MVSIALDQLSTEEKLAMMESLWDSLCAKTGSIASPSWHGDILAEREEAIRNGNDDFEDWETAKAALRNHAE
jgi:putative addiction module component